MVSPLKPHTHYPHYFFCILSHLNTISLLADYHICFEKYFPVYLLNFWVSVAK